MAACEKCWAQASRIAAYSSRMTADVYRDLLLGKIERECENALCDDPKCESLPHRHYGDRVELVSAPEPTAVERIVAAVESILSDFDTVMNVRAESRDVAQAVVVAIRAMSPKQRYALIGDALAENECRITVSAFDLTDAEADAMFDRVADAAHELDEQVMCSGVGPVKVRP